MVEWCPVCRAKITPDGKCPSEECEKLDGQTFDEPAIRPPAGGLHAPPCEAGLLPTAGRQSPNVLATEEEKIILFGFDEEITYEGKITRLRAHVRAEVEKYEKGYKEAMDRIYNNYMDYVKEADKRAQQAVEKAMGELRTRIETASQGYDVSCVEFGGGDLALGRLRMCEQIIEDIDARWPTSVAKPPSASKPDGLKDAKKDEERIEQKKRMDELGEKFRKSNPCKSPED